MTERMDPPGISGYNDENLVDEYHEPAEQVTPEEAERRHPDTARAERAGETPPHADAERLEAALRERGPLVGDRDDRAAREADIAPGGSSLT